jgi:hypothetical protein
VLLLHHWWLHTRHAHARRQRVLLQGLLLLLLLKPRHGWAAQ